MGEIKDIIPTIFPKDQAMKKVDFVNDVMKVALLSGTYNECKLQETVSYDDISIHEISPLYGYHTGGLDATGKGLHVDDQDYSVVYEMADVEGMKVVGGTLGPVRYGVLYDLSNDNHLVYIFNFGEDITVDDGADFKIKINDGGLMKAKPYYDCDEDVLEK